MKIFIDTNIVLDVLLKREGLFEASGEVLSLFTQGHHLGVSRLTFTTSNYIVAKEYSKKEANKHLRNLRDIVFMLPCSVDALDKAITSGYSDFEDAVQYYTALEHGYEAICTRNVKDFKDTSIPVYTPEELLNKIKDVP